MLALSFIRYFYLFITWQIIPACNPQPDPNWARVLCMCSTVPHHWVLTKMLNDVRESSETKQDKENKLIGQKVKGPILWAEKEHVATDQARWKIFQILFFWEKAQSKHV